MFECHICGRKTMTLTGEKHVSINGIVRMFIRCTYQWCKWQGTLEQKTIEQEN